MSISHSQKQDSLDKRSNSRLSSIQKIRVDSGPLLP